MTTIRLTALALLGGLAMACGGVAPLFCDENTPCTDPDRPFCDLTGEFPASEGHGRTCISDPFDAGTVTDAGDDTDAPTGPIKQVVTSQFHTCVLTVNGDVKCWGERLALGYGPAVIENIGDDETPDTVGFVPIGEPVIALSAGGAGGPNTCALTESRKVLCWGGTGAAGYSVADFGQFVGDDETPAMAGAHPLPAVSQLSSFVSDCVITASTTPTLECFGNDQPVANALAVNAVTINAGGAPEKIRVGNRAACVLLAGGVVRCWGNNHIGIPGTPEVLPEDLASSPALILGGPVADIAHGGLHHCALLESGDVRCWGNGSNGRLGNQSTETIGDDEPLLSSGTLNFGARKATQLCEGCALLDDATVQCWGPVGRNSFGNSDDVGAPAEVPLGGPVDELSCSSVTTCAVMNNRSSLRCWGVNTAGQLGMGSTETIVGDEPTELPAMLEDIPLGI